MAPDTAALRDWPCTNAGHLGMCSEDHVHADHVAGLEAVHPILCRCPDCLADEYGYTPSTEPDPSLVEDGAA